MKALSVMESNEKIDIVIELLSVIFVFTSGCSVDGDRSDTYFGSGQ